MTTSHSANRLSARNLLGALCLLAAAASASGCESLMSKDHCPKGERYDKDGKCQVVGGEDAGDDDAAVTECGTCLVPTPVCDETTKTCVGCVDGEDCGGEKSKCSPAQECVACLAKADCVSAAASKCDESNECVACGDEADCSHINGKPHCEAGVCKACTIATEATDCGLNSCNPATGVCTATPRESVVACGACVADSECGSDYRCIPLSYMTEGRGGYCLKLASASCEQPLGSITISRVSLSGAPVADYCGINESQTTCEAILARNSACAGGQPTECAAEGARCEMIGMFNNKCTYTCFDSNECESGYTCTNHFCDK